MRSILIFSGKILARFFNTVPKYTSNVAFNNWCYRISNKFHDEAHSLYKNTIDYKLDSIDRRLRRIDRYIDSYIDDLK